jgi:hypothetical protein
MALEPERRVRRWPDRARLPRLFLLAVLARLAAALIGLSATLAVLAAAGAFTRTSCVVFLLAGLAVVAAHAVDFWDYHDGRMIRFLSLVGATSLVVASLATRYGRAWAIVLLLLLAAWAYRTYGTPVRYVATGLLALLSALTFGGSLIKSRDTWRDPDTPALQRLAAAGEWPFPASGDCDSIVVVMAASGGGSRAAVYAALTLERLAAAYPRIAGRLQCISSVSGGSLANAAYVARLYRHQGRDGPPDLADLPAAAARDYLFPTLFGALVPGISRGGAIERAWRQHAGLDTISTQALVDGWRVARDRRRSTPPFPLPLFNSCTLDGHDLVVSPLPRSAYSQPPHHYRPVAAEAGGAAARPRTDTTWVYDRDAIYGLEDLLPGYNPRLDQAVRASANFPFGFPLVEVETPAANLYLDPEHGAGGGVVTVGLTDGGVLSNSGLWSLYHLLTNHCEVLKPRGVLLIVVEASKMPEYRSDAHQTLALYGAIGDQGPIGQNLIRRMYDLLEQRYGNRLAVVQIDIPPTEGDNVLTTWSLGDGDLAQLRISFATQWRKQADGIAARWRFLQTGLIDGRVPATNPFIPGTDRPPLN